MLNIFLQGKEWGQAQGCVHLSVSVWWLLPSLWTPRGGELMLYFSLQCLYQLAQREPASHCVKIECVRVCQSVSALPLKRVCYSQILGGGGMPCEGRSYRGAPGPGSWGMGELGAPGFIVVFVGKNRRGRVSRLRISYCESFQSAGAQGCL